MKPFAIALALSAGVLAVLWHTPPSPAHADSYDWKLPKGFPIPYVPADNPMTAAKVELGRYLFYDRHISANGSMSCATCHKPELAFTDGRAVGMGAFGESHSRGPMSLVNIAYAGALTWSNPEMTRLEDQAMTPLYGEHPVEQGMRKGDFLLNMLRLGPQYNPLFKRAFPNEADPFTVENATKAIASFERSIISARSPYDRYHYDRDDSAISDSAKHGETLFFSQQLSCFRCHGGFNFTDSSVYEGTEKRKLEFHNTGLYNIAGKFSFPEPNVGIYEFTHNPEDVGKFKAPTLRNIAITGPFMHDGSIKTLEEVIDHYAAGGRTIHGGPNSGVGHDNPNKDPLIGGFQLSAQDRRDLIAFLESLTDDAVLTDPRFASPW